MSLDEKDPIFGTCRTIIGFEISNSCEELVSKIDTLISLSDNNHNLISNDIKVQKKVLKKVRKKIEKLNKFSRRFVDGDFV